MKIRKAKIEDIEGIYDIELDSFSVPWTRDSIMHELARTDLTMYYVLEDENKKIWGYAGLWLVIDEGQITNIALHHDMRGRGYGEQLLRKLMELAWQKGCTDIFLEVRFSNVAAQKLYRKLGYTVISVRKEYYAEPIEDAYVMSCQKKNYNWAAENSPESRA